jgi:hypothetical protein
MAFPWKIGENLVSDFANLTLGAIFGCRWINRAERHAFVGCTP